jgi:hypothetical protein
MRRLAGLVALIVSLSMLGVSPVAATKGPDHKVPLCHRTASDSNPYVFIEVDVASLPAHLNNLPGHPRKHGRDDFLPSAWQIAHRTCADEPSAPGGNTEPTPPLGEVGPQTPSVAPKAAFVGPCADPRLKAAFVNLSDEPVTFRWSFRRAKDGVRKVVVKTIPPSTAKITKWRWVRGRGSHVWIRANGERVADMRVWQGPAWGTRGCVK